MQDLNRTLEILLIDNNCRDDLRLVRLVSTFGYECIHHILRSEYFAGCKALQVECLQQLELFFFLKEREKMIFSGNRRITNLPGFFYSVRSAKDEISLCQAAGSGLEISSETR